MEAVLGFVLGTISVVFGYRLIALGYDRTVSVPFLALFGIVLTVIGALAVIASIAVLRGRTCEKMGEYLRIVRPVFRGRLKIGCT